MRFEYLFLKFLCQSVYSLGNFEVLWHNVPSLSCPTFHQLWIYYYWLGVKSVPTKTRLVDCRWRASYPSFAPRRRQKWREPDTFNILPPPGVYYGNRHRCVRPEWLIYIGECKSYIEKSSVASAIVSNLITIDENVNCSCAKNRLQIGVNTWNVCSQ